MKKLTHPISVTLLLVAIINILCYAYFIPELGFYLGIPITICLVFLSWFFFEDD